MSSFAYLTNIHEPKAVKKRYKYNLKHTPQPYASPRHAQAFTLLIDRLQEVQDLVDVSLLHLQQVRQPASLVAVAHR